MNKKIAIVDYGMGNLLSVKKALDYIGANSFITSDAEKLKESDAIILPGVGAFPDAIESLKKNGLNKIITNEAKEGKPFLGICLGMQLLFEESEEVTKTKGLGLIKGRIIKIKTEFKIPQIGWNSINIPKECELLKGVLEKSYVYFVHSYCAALENKDNLNAYCDYGAKIPAVVSSKNVFGIQFHPEKSGEIGLKMLKNFWELI
ncbi:imidazole glycerol phosphate synthase subunit HisH [Clostridium felsineum]|uniref:imidazole glycerol phosphate synthase subunit HisH n=1 Tax=Clostridium felsineum TaxID=36839 RepID=UPI00098C3182|nr:imidazole glycerol phosphate synthase subunit HisH [Clostridium felsineum]URZ01426.1 Imidazole glycerol phosphate synthase subunit HisH [Clostridium felsineum]